ncbi:Holliday junction resolvase RuvX [Candidatus Parcubacteria bacterium]|jgi:putative holliday junction resolvase|nr:Holliday junction resolvase RuvX [Candidatus Parcubacteria bacterium]
MDRPKRLLGVDYGDKRVGIALADMGSIALPYKILDNKGKRPLLDDLNNIIEQELVDIVVVGLPHSLSGQSNERLEVTKNFVDFLSQSLSLPVQTVDEQMTSKMFSKMGINKNIDKHSAAAILDTFISQNNA